MSRSLRRTVDFNGLKDYEVASLKKQIKNKHNRDRNGSKIKHDQQTVCLGKTEVTQNAANNEVWDSQYGQAYGWS